jgi:predicted MFS family arabinose efflux permease
MAGPAGRRPGQRLIIRMRAPGRQPAAGGPAAAAGGPDAAAGGPAAAAGGRPGLTRPLIVLLATACGAAVANNYYAQPLLHTIGASFGVAGSTAGLLVTAGQVGYALGLAFLVPLGDILERRRLITRMLVVTSAALAAAAAAPNIAALASALVIVGVTTVVAQIIVPMTASLAADSQRGRAVGTVMSGLMIGVLLARVVSGVVAATIGWRWVFVIAAGTMLLLAAVLRRRLPTVEPQGSSSYRALLRSVLTLVREEPVLRQRMALGAVAMGSFSILWTAVAFLLSGPPYRYGSAVIGLFGLAGLAGAVAAPLVGRLADRGYRRYSTLGAIIALLASWGLLALGGHSLAALIPGVVLLDLGAQALHISNQSDIYSLRPEMYSRLNTAYMLGYFTGGAVMSAAASLLFSTAGWNGVCVLGALTALAGLAIWPRTRRQHAR